MPKARPVIYDTRFFVEHFYSKEQGILKLTRLEIESNVWEKLVSVITLHEFYRLNLEKHGREVALIRTNMIRDSFKIIDVNSEISIRGAELSKNYSVPMGDGLIAATTQVLQGVCVTDDPHIRSMKEIKTRWLVKY